MKLFNRKQLENIKLASKDDTRMALNGLYFKGNSTISTDGHKLMKVTYTPPESESKEEWPVNGVQWLDSDASFILPRSTVEKALQNIPKKDGHPLSILSNVAVGLIQKVDGEPSRATCQTSDLINTNNVEAQIVDVKFPDYERVIPDYENSELKPTLYLRPDSEYRRVGIDAHMLKEICAQLEKYNSKHHIVLHIGDENQAVVITANDGAGTEALAVLMPQII